MLLVLLQLILSVAQASEFALPPKYKERRLTMQAQTQFFTSTANYDRGGGAFESLKEGRSYNNLTTWLGAHYSLPRRFTVFTSAAFAYAQSKNVDATRNNSEFTELRLGTQYLPRARWLSVVPELFAVVAFNPVSTTTDQVITGEGVMAFQGGAWAQSRIWGLTPYGYVGLRWQGDGRAAILPYRVGIYRGVATGFSFGGSFEGHFSVLDDEYASNPTQRSVVTDRVNGRSMRFYSVNPSVYEVRGFVGMNFSPTMNLQAAVAQTINGASTAAGTSIMAHFNWHFDDVSGFNFFESKPKESKGPRFQIIEPDDYDETLFDPESEE